MAFLLRLLPAVIGDVVVALIPDNFKAAKLSYFCRGGGSSKGV
jgi:hypothetical protein